MTTLDLTVQHYRRADLKPFERNSRLHSEGQVAKLVESIKTFGWTIPILIDEQGVILAGHGRILAAAKLELETVPCIMARDWTDAQKRAYVIADNQLTIAGGWDMSLLKSELQGLAELDVNVDMLGFPAAQLDKLLNTRTVEAERTQAANTIDNEVEQRCEFGDVWQLGPHRIVCGDSTKPETVGCVVEGGLVDLVHADPPYGMGKEADGVANDNLTGAALDDFQDKWLDACGPFLRDNASAYMWGNAEDLWRWWLTQNGARPDWSVRNELVWDKTGTGKPGAASARMRGYTTNSERCLFLMRGEQHLSSENADEYWEGQEPLRQWMQQQVDAVDWQRKDVDRITGTQMAVRWLSKSQFQVITREHYDTLRAAAFEMAFAPTYDEFLIQWADIIDAAKMHRVQRQRELEARRSYFDNEHEVMTDVMQFPRVLGDDRFGHATPKPVDMIARLVKSSCPDGGVVYEPFLGTGSTLLACDITGRRCLGVEIEPRYVDIVLHRWEKQTGARAEKIG